MKTPGMISPAKHVELRKNLRKKIAMDVTQGDVLCLRKSVAPSGSGVRNGRRRPVLLTHRMYRYTEMLMSVPAFLFFNAAPELCAGVAGGGRCGEPPPNQSVAGELYIIYLFILFSPVHPVYPVQSCSFFVLSLLLMICLIDLFLNFLVSGVGLFGRVVLWA